MVDSLWLPSTIPETLNWPMKPAGWPDISRPIGKSYLAPTKKRFRALNLSFIVSRYLLWLWDPQEAPLLNPDRSYPRLSLPVSFVCFDNRCSLPLYAPQDLQARIEEIRNSYANSQF